MTVHLSTVRFYAFSLHSYTTAIDITPKTQYCVSISNYSTSVWQSLS